MLVGKLHPQFFEVSSIFHKFKRSYDGEVLQLVTPYFTLRYCDEHLECDDPLVLKDFAQLIHDTYGEDTKRKEYYKKINWKTVPQRVNVVHVGVCILKDNVTSGWNGGVNSIWYDDDPPGEVIHDTHQFWVNKLLDEVENMTVKEVKLYDREEALANLMHAKIHKKAKVGPLIDAII